MDPHAFVSVRGTFQKGSGTFAIRPQHVLGKHWTSWFVSGVILSVEVVVERTFYASTDGFGFIEHIGSKHIFFIYLQTTNRNKGIRKFPVDLNVNHNHSNGEGGRGIWLNKSFRFDWFRLTLLHAY